MADGSAHSRYVKLTKEQAPLEEITPGELNQPIQVPQVLRCPNPNSLMGITICSFPRHIRICTNI